MGNYCAKDTSPQKDAGKRKRNYTVDDDAAGATGSEGPSHAAAAAAGGGAADDSAKYHPRFQSYPYVFGEIDVTAMTVYTPDRTLFVGSEKGEVARIDPTTGRVLHRISALHKSDINKLIFNATANAIFSCGRDMNLSCISVPTSPGDVSYPTTSFSGHTKNVTCVTSSSDGQRLVSGSRDNTVRLWDVETQRCLDFQDEKLNVVHCCTWVEELGVVAQGGEDLTIRLWDIRGQGGTKISLQHTLTGFDYHPICCQLLPEGTGHQLLVGHNGFNGKGCMITTWDLRMHKAVNHMTGHENTIRWLCVPQRPSKLQLKPNEQLLSASDDGTIRTWNLSTHVEEGRAPISEGRVTTLVELGDWDATGDGVKQSVFAVACRDGAIATLCFDTKGNATRLRVFGGGGDGGGGMSN